MSATIVEDRLAALPELVLRSGPGPAPNGQVDGCVMQLVAYVAGEPWSDHPDCASPAITAFCVAWNDSLADVDRQLLKPYIPRIVGTRTTQEDELRRAWMATDWLARTFAPAWLRLANLDEHAAALEALPELSSDELADAALPIISAAASAAESAAESAAASAAWSAAWLAARSAAESAAQSAAQSAARSAAESAAWLAAQSAAESAAEKALAPTVKQLRESAFDLLSRMIAVGQKEPHRRARLAALRNPPTAERG